MWDSQGVLEVSSLDGVRLPLTILLGALIIGGVTGVVGITMQPKSDDSRLHRSPSTHRQYPPRRTASSSGGADVDADHGGVDDHRRSRTATGNLRSDRNDRRWGPP